MGTGATVWPDVFMIGDGREYPFVICNEMFQPSITVSYFNLESPDIHFDCFLLFIAVNFYLILLHIRDR